MTTIGDLYSRKEQVENIMMECVDNYIRKAAVNKTSNLALIGMKMAVVPDLTLIASSLSSVTDLNLSKNYLFNIEQIFDAISPLVSIKKLNLSYNSLNGLLPATAELLTQLEDINLEVSHTITIVTINTITSTTIITIIIVIIIIIIIINIIIMIIIIIINIIIIIIIIG
jgi:Leucine-rich repeat (LRR) protein